MTTQLEPLTREDLRQEFRDFRSDLRAELDRTLQHYATKADFHELRADLKALETRLTVRLFMSLATLGGVLVAVDRLWT